MGSPSFKYISACELSAFAKESEIKRNQTEFLEILTSEIFWPNFRILADIWDLKKSSRTQKFRLNLKKSVRIPKFRFGSAKFASTRVSRRIEKQTFFRHFFWNQGQKLKMIHLTIILKKIGPESVYLCLHEELKQMGFDTSRQILIKTLRYFNVNNINFSNPI